MSLQNIYTKLSKYSNAQGLKVQERENTKFAKKWAFSSVSELEEASDNLQIGSENAEELLNGLIDFVDEFENEMKQKGERFNDLYDRITKARSEAGVTLQDFNDAAFELGVNPDDLNQYKLLKSQLTYIEDIISDVESQMRVARQYLNF